jgi:hypothetical protein
LWTRWQVSIFRTRLLLHARRPRHIERKYAAHEVILTPTHSLFLIVGNTRIGSTWLATSLHFLPGIRCRREIRWRMHYQDRDLDEHVYLEGENIFLKEAIRYACREWLHGKDVAFGSKFKLDPYGFVDPTAFSDLASRLEPDVHVLLLKRSYFEIFQSWKAIGIRHLANGSVDNLVERDRALVERMIAHHSHPVVPLSVALTWGREPATTSVPDNTIFYPAESAIDDLLVMFFNDVMAFSAFRHASRFQVLEYKDIRNRFFRIAQVLNPALTEVLTAAILQNPLTQRVEPDNAEFVAPAAGLRAVSDHLDGLFRRVADGRLDVGDVVRFDRAGHPRFHVRGLRDILALYPETRDLAGPARKARGALIERLLSRGRETIWIPQRPVYAPVGLPAAPLLAT